MNVDASDAQAQLFQLLDEVERGATITITRHGSPVALLLPATDVDRRRVEETIEALKEFRRGKRLGPVTLRELIDDGRRT
ncbi:type II toxin-antitoxin system Phd/YefM family antitoxin [Sphaerobacter thermophilus]|jgi:prevent-host-death family protein|uniref:Antitoxin n=1 Tax=Sphaerobacter thermophilus (strain ATCC 49802 / DSM 20745 / KCCM 41009 / NCIMB 13125 / S 6022) TaxID=479434 RepID=D1C9I1_SPHTD|nr:type II toxin-antitoxin system prevent-host-death family antitoxin [Sphaerobacter thermophilus]ACZ40474.1 prevent-host-death family protein [Sphaerobacter thermophilus DSM 20745]PZN63711.1 MAG: type II toxin-antitoxin system prevent-host-death family antitoxin [Sphaerobacter thermophilus]